MSIDESVPLVVGEDNLKINMNLATFHLNGKLGYGVAAFGQKSKSLEKCDPLNIIQKETLESYSQLNLMILSE